MMTSFWNSVAILREIEFVALVVAMIVPVLCGTVLLTVHYRVKALVNKTSVIQGTSYEENVQRLENMNRALNTDLRIAQSELSSLRHITAPRRLTDEQRRSLLENLRGVKGAPVIVSAYAFEDESAAYAGQIAAALRDAGWDVLTNKASMNDFKGISLGTVNVSPRDIPGLHELARAFAAAHLEVHQREIAPDTIGGPLQDGCLLVVVGRK